ncbi:MAG TPA: MFS transporter [Acidimicrobiales bacterium]|nr:MFS transporter [Acidimicrobiales bacterium]
MGRAERSNLRAAPGRGPLLPAGDSGEVPIAPHEPPDWRTVEPLPRRRLIFFICAIALFMASVDSTIVATALPRIGSALHSRLNWLGWTITIYSLGQIVMLPLAGRISDQFGRKRLFVACAVVFTVSSVACGLATSIYVLIPLRLVQSLGGGGFLPSASGIVADHFGRNRDRALGMFSSIFPIGGVAGPIFGGIITQYWDWRGIFFVNLPIGAALIVLIVRYVPHSAKGSPEPLDVRGIALLACTIVTGMLSITTLGGASASPTSPGVLVPGLAAIALGALFIRHIGRVPHPIIPLRLIKGKNFGAMNVLNVLFGGAGFGFGVLIPLYAENRYGIRSASAGTVLSAQAVGMVLFAALASYNLRRTGYRLPMVLGFGVASVSLVFLSIGARGLSGYLWLSLFAMTSGIGLGTVAPAANNATLALAPNQVAAISGLRATFRQTGSILCVSTVTAILARSSDKGIAQAHIFWVLALFLCATIALTFAIPDQRESW